jgi:hypothetical protein
MDLWHQYLTNQDKIIDKWTHYFPIYEQFFSNWKGKTVTFLEIGLSEGGSLQMWKRYFGPYATIVGVDIDESCKQVTETGVHVRIGDQASADFLSSLVNEFGPFDLVVDDGSHKMSDVRATFELLYPSLTKNGVYIVEDLHCAYDPQYGGGYGSPSSFIEWSKSLVDEMHREFIGQPASLRIVDQTRSISFFKNVVAFQKGSIAINHIGRTGRIARSR